MIQHKIDKIDDGKGGIVTLDKGEYHLDAGLLCRGDGVTLQGQGRSATTLIVHHDDDVIRFKGRFSKLKDLTIKSGSERSAGNGVVFEADDVPEPAPNNRMWSCHASDVRITDQPGHGMVWISTPYSSGMDRVSTHRNGGHGIVIGRGECETGRSHDACLAAGVMSIRDCLGYDNIGHGVCVGHPSDDETPAVRVWMQNVDYGRNAYKSGVRYSIDQIWINGTNVTVDQSGFYGGGGVFFAGRALRMRDNRFINVQRCVRIGQTQAFYPTHDIEIDGMSVRDGVVDYAVIIYHDGFPTEPRHIRIRAMERQNINHLWVGGNDVREY